MTTKVVKYANSRKLKGDEVFLSKIPKERQRDGWISSDQYLPEDYELVEIKEDFLSKPIHGWAQGEKWVGLRVRERDYKYWKFSKGVYECP